MYAEWKAGIKVLISECRAIFFNVKTKGSRIILDQSLILLVTLNICLTAFRKMPIQKNKTKQKLRLTQRSHFEVGKHLHAYTQYGLSWYAFPFPSRAGSIHMANSFKIPVKHDPTMRHFLKLKCFSNRVLIGSCMHLSNNLDWLESCVVSERVKLIRYPLKVM